MCACLRATITLTMTLSSVASSPSGSTLPRLHAAFVVVVLMLLVLCLAADEEGEQLGDGLDVVALNSVIVGDALSPHEAPSLSLYTDQQAIVLRRILQDREITNPFVIDLGDGAQSIKMIVEEGREQKELDSPVFERGYLCMCLHHHRLHLHHLCFVC